MSIRLQLSGEVTGAFATIWFPEFHIPPIPAAQYDSQLSHSETIGTINELTNTHARGVVEGTIDRIGVTYYDPNCIQGDVGGICGESLTADIPFRIEFDATLTSAP